LLDEATGHREERDHRSAVWIAFAHDTKDTLATLENGSCAYAAAETREITIANRKERRSETNVRSYPRGTACEVIAGGEKSSACGRRVINDSLRDERYRRRRRDAKHRDVYTTTARHEYVAAFNLQRLLALVQQQLDGSGGRPLFSLRGSEQA
jgi:hypothetical protein